MTMKRILKMSVVTTVIACCGLYSQRALVSAAQTGEAAATLSQLGEPAQISADARRTTFGGDGPGHPADFNGDGAITAADLAVLLGSWGACPDCLADLDGDGMVGASDLAALLGDWGQYEYKLEIGPVAGLTTAWHHSPEQSAIPLGSTVQFRVVLDPGTPVAWIGAIEVYRDEDESVASCEFNEIGQAAVRAEVDDAQEGPSLLESAFDVVATAAADITITPLQVWVDPVVIDGNLPEDELNQQTLSYYDGESIAALRDLGNGQYRTSTLRRVYMSAQADPAGFEPLIEWRLDGEAQRLGGSHSEVFFSNATLHDVSVGPTDNPAEIEIEIYRVVITGHDPEGDIIPEGVPVTYTAVTVPPGYEEDITWLASTKYGTGVPILGSGPTFTTQFDDTFGPHPDGGLWQWLGVKGDNFQLGQDQKTDSFIADFIGPDDEQADQAYLQLFQLGVVAIGPLLGTTDNEQTYAGGATQDETSSIALLDPASVALVAIYLVDGILRDDPTPHYAPILLSDDNLPPPQALAEAIFWYLQWWDENEGLSLEELQALPFPLEGTGTAWRGPLLFVAAAPGSGTEEGTTSTPAKTNAGGAVTCESNPDGDDADALPDPYAWVLTPKNAGGATPYNCLAWAIKCLTDRWVQPKNVAGQHWMDILDDYGYDTANPVACAGTCPAGQGPKIKMVFHLAAGATANDDNWRHAMKQEADGDWTSKNGQGSRWKDITDCAAFLDKHYKTPAGKTRELKCFCK